MLEVKKWISASHLMERWRLQTEDDLHQVILNTGLPVYTKSRMWNVRDPFYQEIPSKGLQASNRFWELKHLAQVNTLLSGVMEGLAFKVEDIERIEKDHSELVDDAYTKETLQAEVKNEKALLQCQPGTKWDEIRITLIADDTVRIKTPSIEERFSYHELGLSDKRKGDNPTVLWHLLVQFAKNQGILSPVAYKEGSIKTTLYDSTKRLNRHFQDLFRINESIFKAHFKKKKRYETKIMFSDQTQLVSKGNISS